MANFWLQRTDGIAHFRGLSPLSHGGGVEGQKSLIPSKYFPTVKMWHGVMLPWQHTASYNTDKLFKNLNHLIPNHKITVQYSSRQIKAIQIIKHYWKQQVNIPIHLLQIIWDQTEHSGIHEPIGCAIWYIIWHIIHYNSPPPPNSLKIIKVGTGDCEKALCLSYVSC